uniref:Uncharacterized protein n=1 Tax=Arundo donax TaxID=35708 RepID=A0A0A9DCC6_ARUDO
MSLPFVHGTSSSDMVNSERDDDNELI